MNKHLLVIVCLIVQLSLHFVEGGGRIGFDVENEAEFSLESDPREGILDIDWSTDCAPAGGVARGTFVRMTFTGCGTDQKCNLKTGKSYEIFLTFKTGRNETSLALDISAVAASPSNPSMIIETLYSVDTTFIENSTHSLKEGVIFTSEAFGDKSGTYALQFKMYSLLDSEVILCQSFPINLDAKKPLPNTGTSLEDPCTSPYESCAFENSQCLSSLGSSSGLQCLCDDSSWFETGKGCKKILGTYCTKSDECIENANCPKESGLDFGFCECAKSSLSLIECSSGIRNSPLLAVLIPIILLLCINYIFCSKLI